MSGALVPLGSKQKRLFASALTLAVITTIGALAPVGAKQSATLTENDWPVLPHKAMHANATKAQIFQYDNSPLQGRKVLLLIHGGGAEKRKLFRWGHLLKALNNNEEFSKHFKIYLYRYDSDARLSITTPQLHDAILQLKSGTGGKPIDILCLSMGGNLAQMAMLSPAIESAVSMVFALATPFHGSPLFSPGWFQYSLDKLWYMPWARPVHNLDYMLYFSRHKSLQQDLKWDNFDNLIPDLGKFKSAFPIGPSGTLTPEADANPKLAKINESPRINKSKFITYGGYLVNIYLMKGERKFIEETILAPINYVTVKLPVQLGREHPALRLLNFEMSNLKINPDAAENSQPSPHTYELNDGITPLSSALFMPPEFMRKHPMLVEDKLDTVPQSSDVRLVRIFRDMDHISFLDGKPPRHFGRTDLIDQAHPGAGRHMLYDWLSSDLLKYGLEPNGDSK
jgi:hypothetical protein